MRAITHAAFTIGLLEYTRINELSHPGFVVLDTPLLAYREPEGDEDDLSGTDVQDRFYEYLRTLNDRQVIILENNDPPESIKKLSQTQFLAKTRIVAGTVFFQSNPEWQHHFRAHCMAFEAFTAAEGWQF